MTPPPPPPPPPHNDQNKYNKEFYENFWRESLNSAKIILPLVINMFPKIESAADFGCGTGVWLSALRDLGIKDIVGYDGAWVEKEMLKIPFENFIVVDLDKKIALPRKYDIAISIETAEHIQKDSAKIFVETLTNASDIVLFSAAIPFQGGTNHYNEQWQDYWCKIFYEFGYCWVETFKKQIWDNKGIRTLYKQNLGLFVKNEKLKDIVVLKAKEKMWDIVHPETYLLKINQIKQFKEDFSMILGEKINIEGKWNKLQSEQASILSSRSYRIGRAFTWLPRQMRDLFCFLRKFSKQKKYKNEHAPSMLDSHK